ncbi:hypothetical protein NAMH_1376 [Nautilia profundicola AmH]|uniref:Uncharacterized protein n=1 Tax=Nautilia profundicola (strain ATCC BAA-1463 / DSM 18972 / AmH) TaxID=598659 RepID=B9L5Y1_NAUPA|nr:hypothetical protein [Nautilia profundicola]ACM93665.1 hypothetical protein NAMH_1376 [Nautilia profundicola AmH]
MNRIEEYLNSLDKKNLVLLYASIIIAVFIVYYNYNYNILQEKIDNYNVKIVQLKKKLESTNSLRSVLSELKTQLKKLKKQNVSLNEDLKYLNVLVKTSSILHINEKNFLNILKNVLHNAIQNNIKASYTIDKNTDEYKKYIINVQGEFEPEMFDKFYEFIKNLEKIKAIKEITQLKIIKKDKVQFDMNIVFWSLL